MRHLVCILALALVLSFIPATRAPAAAPGLDGEWTICGRDWSLKRAYISIATARIDEAAGTVTFPKGLLAKTRFHPLMEVELTDAKETRRYTLSDEDDWRRAVRKGGPADPGPVSLLRVHDSVLLLRTGNNERLPLILLRQGATFRPPNKTITGRWFFSVPGYATRFADGQSLPTPPFVIVFDLDKRTETAFAVLERDESSHAPRGPEVTKLARDKVTGKGVKNELRLRLFDIFYRFVWLDKDLLLFHLIHPSTTGGGLFILRRVTPETAGRLDQQYPPRLRQ